MMSYLNPVSAMTITQFCAALLYVASFEISLPEYNRHWLARRILLQALRGIGS